MTQSPNQFSQAAFLGMTDLRLNYNTIAARFDPAGAGTLVGGQAVKWVAGVSGVPLVAPSTAQSDVVAGFVNYNIKDIDRVPGDQLEISLAGNVMFLLAGAAIVTGEFLVQDPATVGEVIPVTGASGFPIIGYALENADDAALVRVMLMTPSNQVDA